MGLRGRLPAIVKTEPEPLDDLSPPDWLGPHGKAHWLQHAEWLAENNLLNTSTVTAWELCCDLWDRVRNGDHYTTNSQSYARLAKMFRLMPSEMPGKPPADRHQDKPEFTFED